MNFIGYPPEDAISPEAEHLALKCIRDAESAGLSKQALEAEFGDLLRYMNDQIERRADEEVAAKVAKGD